MENIARDAVLGQSEEIPSDNPKIKGFDFNQGINYDLLLKSFSTMGFQASGFGHAVEEINRMIKWRLSDEPIAINEDELLKNPETRKQIKCTIFLGFSSNQVSCGNRDIIRYLCEHKMVDCLVTTAGGIEEDFIKCLKPFYLGDFSLKGRDLRNKGINRIGNILVPNNNYCAFENWMIPLLDEMLKEQIDEGRKWTPSTIIHRLGERINNKDSVYYWCAKNNIPVFCPAITDGSLGDMMFFHSFNKPGFVCDIVEDIRKINKLAIASKKTGMIILGGGVAKHHVCNANLMRNGADFSVYVNTAQEFDGSDAGARPDEAISWGKIRPEATPVKVYGEASIIFPLLVAQTFAQILNNKL